MLTARFIRIRLTLLLALLLAGSICASAAAASITVQLRVEGATATLFEGNIATAGESIETPSSGGQHPCNYKDNGNFEGFPNGGNASGTPTSALHDAALASGLAFDAEWFSSSGDFFVSQVGADVNQSSPPFDSWGYAVNDTTAPVGGCQVALAPGNEVLWAYNYFNLTHLLGLSGPAAVNAGTPFTVHVTDAQNGSPIAGAAIGAVVGGVTSTLPGSATTNSSGDATVTLAAAGVVKLKATEAESVRSNGIAVCVHDGADGTCGTSLPGSLPGPAAPGSTPPAAVSVIAKVAGVANGRIYRHGASPRILRGTVTVPVGGTLRQVHISLQRRRHGRCFVLSDLRGAFVRSRCGAQAFFSVGGSESFSYLLPARLSPGRYTYDIEALESSGRAIKPVAGVSHVVFRVR
jgi:hypothetical protein